MVISGCSLLGYVFPEVSGNAFANLFIKGSVVATIYVAAIYQLKLAPEIFNGIKQRFLKK
jgi:hypothetical protein